MVSVCYCLAWGCILTWCKLVALWLKQEFSTLPYDPAEDYTLHACAPLFKTSPKLGNIILLIGSDMVCYIFFYFSRVVALLSLLLMTAREINTIFFPHYFVFTYVIALSIYRNNKII